MDCEIEGLDGRLEELDRYFASELREICEIEDEDILKSSIKAFPEKALTFTLLNVPRMPGERAEYFAAVSKYFHEYGDSYLSQDSTGSWNHRIGRNLKHIGSRVKRFA